MKIDLLSNSSRLEVLPVSHSQSMRNQSRKGNTPSSVRTETLFTKLNIVLISISLLAIASVAWGSLAFEPKNIPQQIQKQPLDLSHLTLDELVNLPDDQLAKVDIAQMDLLCATGLPNSENLDVPACLQELEKWTSHCRSEINKNMYRYYSNPSLYHSEWLYRIELLDTIMKQDFGIHYDDNHPNSQNDHDFFLKSDHLFINGLLSPNRNGSCSSMPVLLVAIGRRLGYPLYLVSCRNHFFARWDDRRDRFNILNSNDNGMVTRPDSYFRSWPFPMTDEMIQNNGYLKSIEPRQQLAELLINRGVCLHENGRIDEAIEVAKIGHRLMPTNTAFIPKS